MSLEDELLKIPAVQEKTYSKGSRTWDFTVEPAPHDQKTQSISMSSTENLKTEDDWTQAVKDMGGIVADGYRVRLVEMRHQTHGWTREKHGEDATTKPTWWYRFAVEPAVDQHKVDDLVKMIQRKKPAPAVRSTGPTVFHFLAGDLQLGKMDGDGSEGIIAAFMASVDNAVSDFIRLAKTEEIGIVHIAFLGDCIEGNQSQNGRNMWRTKLTVTEQTRILRRLIQYTIDSFYKRVARVEVSVVNGNHDEMQRFQATRGDDGHATEAAITVADALLMNPAAYGHVQVYVPNVDSTYMTREIGSSTFTMAHGHQWNKGKGMDWWAGQAFNWHAAGAAQFLLHGHFHTASWDTKKERTEFCVPTFESESTWYKERHGDMSRRGGIVMTTRDGEFANFRIV
jgi:UDP-2,3-diacylglucosamine pyrophosphatase LpxH